MGGGDLNLKKSWHPSTLRNIERVWKAEQKHDAEQKKIEQLQKELQDERNREDIRSYAENKGVINKKDDRLDWMYAGPAAMVNRDEYLLGRQVDKTFEVMDLHAQGLMNEDANDATLPGSIFSNSPANVSIDLANKVREDPLFAIKKKEQQAKKEILRNPVKMKQLQKYLEASVSKSHKKKSKKKKKKKSSRSSSSSSDSDEDDSKSRKHHSKSQKSSEKYDRNHHRSHKSSKHSSRSRETSNRDCSPKQDKVSIRKRAYDSSDDDVKPKKYGLIGGSKSKRDTSPDGRVDYRKLKLEKPAQEYKKVPRRKLTAEEIEEKRLQMVDNAKWRDDQRRENVRRYREESEKEVEDHSRSRGAKFIAPMLAKAVESGSVEARLKSNKFKIQRSGAEINKNFARR